MDIDNVASLQTYGLTYDWTCYDSTTKKSCYDVDAVQLTTGVSNILTYAADTLPPYHIYRFKFTAYSSSKDATAYAYIILVDYDMPKLTVYWPENILGSYLNLNENIQMEV